MRFEPVIRAAFLAESGAAPRRHEVRAHRPGAEPQAPRDQRLTDRGAPHGHGVRRGTDDALRSTVYVSERRDVTLENCPAGGRGVRYRETGAHSVTSAASVLPQPG